MEKQDLLLGSFDARRVESKNESRMQRYMPQLDSLYYDTSMKERNAMEIRKQEEVSSPLYKSPDLPKQDPKHTEALIVPVPSWLQRPYKLKGRFPLPAAIE